MKNVLILGAGFVSKPLVEYLIGKPAINLTIATKYLDDAIRLKNGRNKRIETVGFDVRDKNKLSNLLEKKDVVISLLPRDFHSLVAMECLRHKVHLITASYISDEMKMFDNEAREKGILFLNEMGLDPGIDHMIAMKIIDKVKLEKGKIVSFESVCGGLPSKESDNNPFGYKFSWNPKGVLLAGKNSATYLKDGKIIKVNKKDLFKHKRVIEIEGLGKFEIYPNRNSLHYKNLYHLDRVKSLFRGTIRNIGWSDTLEAISRIGLLDETPHPEFKDKNFAEILAMLVNHGDSNRVIENTARLLNVGKNSEIIKKLNWLELFSNKKPNVKEYSLLNILTEQMREKMAFGKGERDMVILQIKVLAKFPEDEFKEIKYLLVDYGRVDGESAMSRTVSLPIGIATHLLLQNKIGLRGVQVPIYPEIYIPTLEELKRLGIQFKKEITVKPYALL